MSRLLKTVIAIFILSGCGTLSSCTSETSPKTYLEQEVEHLQKRTIPPDSRLIDQHLPAIHGWVARADWEFQTQYGADKYNEWLADKLRPEFRVHQSAGSSIRFSEQDRGDVETLSVETTTSAGMPRVTVRFEMFPD